MGFGNEYSYSQKETDDRFPEPLFDELGLNICVDADHVHDRVTGRSIPGIISVLGSTPTTCSSKRQISVQIYTCGA